MTIFGINETTHDAALTVIKNGDILFASQSERYSKVKSDWFLNEDLINEALHYGFPDKLAYYEKPFLKKLRCIIKGGFGGGKPFYKQTVLSKVPIQTFRHHYSHATGGYFTSKFKEAVVVVLDSIGEFETSTIWIAKDNTIKQVFSQNYPFSFGLFYSAFTKLIGLEPNKEEYILMGMAAYGDPSIYYNAINSYFPSIKKQKYNFHRGITDWQGAVTNDAKFHIAAAVQKIYEERVMEFMLMAFQLTKQKQLVFMGGCALNCSANTLLWRIFDDIWIMPNPGDAGSSLGAAAALYGRHLNWQTPYLGHVVGREYPVKNILKELVDKQISCVASGRAEFGPRALGNRSILADPRTLTIKHKVNHIKNREQFRPFAPIVLEDQASTWFDMTFSSPYMQYAVKCKFPDKVPAIVHIDGTSRVQTVNKDQHPGLYILLNSWYLKTGIPILLNTSLNIKNQPLLNDEDDCIAWSQYHNNPICC